MLSTVSSLSGKLEMTPFGRWTNIFRMDNGINLQDFAEKIGVTHTYLSALENGKKTKPSEKLVNQIIIKYDLDDEEIASLKFAAKISNRNITVPENFSPKCLKVLSRLIEQAESISRKQIKQINQILEKYQRDSDIEK